VTATVPSRRTQEQRSSATRERLLDATVECLIEYGYAGTTVARVAERAGMTRGAQVHHYPTKADLVAAAVRHVALKQLQQGAADLRDIPRGDDLVDALLDRLWRIHTGPMFVAIIELWVAARSDAELAPHVSQLEPALLLAGTDMLDAPVVAYLAGPAVRNALYLAMDVMRGLVISTWHLSGADRDARWRRAKRQLRTGFPELEA
jgi:AcrR family transcriptional regulator